MVKYRHYKGGIYELLFIAEHSETKEHLVIYRNNKNEIFARPAEMFFEVIEINGVKVKRFEKIND